MVDMQGELGRNDQADEPGRTDNATNVSEPFGSGDGIGRAGQGKEARSRYSLQDRARESHARKAMTWELP